MKNWAGNLSFTPKTIYAPKSIDEIQEAVSQTIEANRTIRTRGSGHSWTGLISSNENYLHLDNFQGITQVDLEQKVISAKAGTKLSHFGPEAFKHKLALENQGDIDKQSLAGALSTGTHGTGLNLRSMANQIKSISFINGNAEEITVDESSTDFNGSRLTLGALGIVTNIAVQMEDAYKLKVDVFPESINSALEKIEERLKNNRHLEMFYFPVGGWSLTKIMNKTNEDCSHRGIFYKLNEVVVENWLYIQMNRLGRVTNGYKMIDKIMQKCVSHTTLKDWSYQAFPTQRDFKFKEMEYAVPVEKFKEVFEALTKKIKEKNFQTLMPIEIRFVKKDVLWLSPAYERDCVYFAIHTYITEDHREYFKAMEEILQSFGGRPHWGKMHSMQRADFEKAYPRFNDFVNLREKFDPKGVFLNQHLLDIFMK